MPKLEAMTLRPHRLQIVLVLALAMAALAGCALTAARPADAARRMEVTIQDDQVFAPDLSKPQLFNRERAFRFIRPLGVTRLRINAVWANVIPTGQRTLKKRPPQIGYDWTVLDSAIDAAARHGVRVQLTLTGPAPAFATGNHRVGPFRPDPKLYADFVSNAARHFRHRVNRYAIWNEPNWHSWLAPMSKSPSLYRKLYFAGYGALKKQDPGAKVLFGETDPYRQRGRSLAPLAFLRKALCVNRRYHRVGHCRRLKADGYAHHPYDFRHRPSFRFPGRDNVTMGTLGRLTRALDRLRRSGALRRPHGGRMPLYFTEYGYFSSGPRKLRARTRMRFLKQGWDIALRNPRVKQNTQYLLVSPPRGSVGDYFDLGLITKGGRKEANYRALRSWFRKRHRRVKHRQALHLPPAPPN
jgi:hypothetical protein